MRKEFILKGITSPLVGEFVAGNGLRVRAERSGERQTQIQQLAGLGRSSAAPVHDRARAAKLKWRMGFESQAREKRPPREKSMLMIVGGRNGRRGVMDNVQQSGLGSNPTVFMVRIGSSGY